MQAFFMLPVPISVLAIAISLLAGVGPGPIACADVPILAAVQAIIFAEAGASANAESIAAVINILIVTSLEKNPASCRTHATRILPR
jgi:hypothetical protein